MNPAQLVTVAHVAEMHGTTSKTVARAIRLGELKAIRVEGVGGKYTHVIKYAVARRWRGPMPHGVNKRYAH